MRRRASFAAPLVLIVACGQPPPPDEPWVERDPEPPGLRRPDAGVRVALASAPDAAPVPDAIPPDARVPLSEQCRRPDLYEVRCNPPGAIIAEIIDVQINDDSVVITIDKGTDDGLAKDFRGELLDDDNRKVKGGEVVILRVNARTAKGKIELTADQVKGSSGRVRLRGY